MKPTDACKERISCFPADCISQFETEKKEIAGRRSATLRLKEMTKFSVLIETRLQSVFDFSKFHF